MSATLTANWDLTPFFPTFQGPEYRHFWSEYQESIQATGELARHLGDPQESNLQAWVQALLAWEDLTSRANHLSAYLECLRAADSRDEAVGSDYAAFHALLAEHKKLDVLVLDMFRRCSEEAFQRFLGHSDLAPAAFRLQRLRTEARLQMSAELETLRADLEVDGLSAWGRLYDQISGKLEFELPGRGMVPMALKVSLLQSPDPALRKAVLEGSNRAWQALEDVLAAALNAIAGARLTVYRRRGIGHFLEPALFDAAISQATLEAMLGAIAQKYEVPRAYLRSKARLIGQPRLGFQDLTCPLPLEGQEEVTWGEACQQISREYGRRYPELGQFCDLAFDSRWIDYESRPGKRPGGFCTSSDRLRESRIFMTFNRTLGDVRTLAHELGHGFHNWVMRDLRPWRRQYPMTLAETASTFAETILTDALLESPQTTERQKLVTLDTRLEAAQTYLLNIPMRFYFEKSFYEERARGEVSVSRLKELMLEAQRQCYGDALDPEQLDPYFWASKLHFYITELSFYNFPYSFGSLFSLGVYARARQGGPEFFRQYEELLRLTGSGTAEEVARKALGVDLESPEFWLDSIALIEEDLKRFEELAPRLLGPR